MLDYAEAVNSSNDSLIADCVPFAFNAADLFRIIRKLASRIEEHILFGYFHERCAVQ
jgi:hypothetical protein